MPNIAVIVVHQVVNVLNNTHKYFSDCSFRKKNILKDVTYPWSRFDQFYTYPSLRFNLTGNGELVRFRQYQSSKPDEYRQID